MYISTFKMFHFENVGMLWQCYSALTFSCLPFTSTNSGYWKKDITCLFRNYRWNVPIKIHALFPLLPSYFCNEKIFMWVSLCKYLILFHFCGEKNQTGLSNSTCLYTYMLHFPFRLMFSCELCICERSVSE